MLETIAHDCVLLLNTVSPVQLDSPWAEKAAETPAHAKQAAQPAGGSLRELLPDGSFGNPEVVLKEAGFEVGDLVRRKKDRKECKIIAVKKKDLRKILKPTKQ